MPTIEERTIQTGGAENAVATCPFQTEGEIAKLKIRNAPHWHALQTGRHIGVRRYSATSFSWLARVLTRDRRYIQFHLGPALGQDALSYTDAVRLAYDWFDGPAIRRIAEQPKQLGRTSELNFCPIGTVYTVGHALRDYVAWTRIARSAGGHYNTLMLINCHLAGELVHIPLDTFTGHDLKALAERVIATRPHRGFSPYGPPVSLDDLSPDEIRRRKRTFNSLTIILRMAFLHAWENGQIQSERPWRCVRRIPVVHAPRILFLNREECARLLGHCTPALRRLVMAALYSGCRVGELAALRVEDVGHQVFGLYIRPFKRNRARFVFLPDEGMAFFLDCCAGKEPRDPVFASDMGKEWRRQHASLFKRAVERAGLPTDFVFHGLRHTYASDLVRQGVPLDVVARQLGHADTRTVANTYGHLAEAFREEMIRSRFTPVSTDYQQDAGRRHAELDALWSKLHAGDWRAYGRLPASSGHPLQSHGRPHADVLRAFGDAR